MQIILLTHSREVSKKTNTGQLVQKLIPGTQTIIWQRTQPDENILKLIASEKIALIYPVKDGEPTANINDFENFILIDSTWQEARKIFNRSPYLQNLPRIEIIPEKPSAYQLRRNQAEGGLCTAECVAELLRDKKCFDAANQLDVSFEKFITQPA